MVTIGKRVLGNTSWDFPDFAMIEQQNKKVCVFSDDYKCNELGEVKVRITQEITDTIR